MNIEIITMEEARTLYKECTKCTEDFGMFHFDEGDNIITVVTLTQRATRVNKEYWDKGILSIDHVMYSKQAKQIKG